VFRKSKMIGVALLFGLLLPIQSKAERTELFQRYYSPKLALQTEKWTFSNNELWLSEEAEQDSNRVRERPKAGLLTYAFESFGATIGEGIGTWGGCLGGLWIGTALSEEEWEGLMDPPPVEVLLGMALGMVVGTPVGSTCGVTITGKLVKQEGAFLSALAGAALGSGCCLICCSAALSADVPYLTEALVLGGFLSIPLGAVIGYNRPIPKKMGDLPKILVGSIVGSAAGYGCLWCLFSLID
jgi:hypothetical protein